MASFIDMAGTRVGRLTVVRPTVIRNRAYNWKCRCDCGAVIEAWGPNLRNGNTQSCGCLHREMVTTHGMYQSRTYRSWANMLSRCRNPKSTDWGNYGARGISVCRRWLKFENFLADMGEAPARYTLDRKNNDGNYSPRNCCWATRSQQRNNQRRK